MRTQEILEFARRFPHHPRHGKRTLTRFLTELSSFDEMIFVCESNGETALIAVLVDKIENPSNSANLEIIGARTELDLSVVVDRLIGNAKAALPEPRDGIEIGVNARSAVTEDTLRKHGFKKHYVTFEMSRGDLSAREPELPDGYHGRC